MDRSRHNSPPTDDRKLVLDPALLMQASLKATGADIHDVTNLISSYTGWHEMLLIADSPDDIAGAGRHFCVAEAALQAFVRGMPAKQALADSQRRLQAEGV